MRIRSKFNQQRDEHQDYREHESDCQFRKARLLLLIKTTILDRHSRRQFHVLHQLGLDLPNGRSEVASFESSGYTDHLTQVLALDLSLSFIDLHGSDLVETEQLPARGTNLQGLYFVERGAHIGRKYNAHFDQPVLLQDRRRSVAGHCCRDRRSDVVCGYSKLRRSERIDVESNGWSADDDAVQRVDNAWHFLDCFFNFVGCCV